MRQANDLEQPIFHHLEEAGKIAGHELKSELGLRNVETKTWHVEKAAEAAHIAGWVKTDIARRLWDLIQKHNWNISRRLVYEVCSPLGYSNAWGDEEESAVSAQNNSSVYCPRCKTEHKIAVFEQENQRLAAVARKHADFWRGVELECRQQHILSCIAKDIREEGLYLLDKSADNNDAEWDGRKDVSERRFPTLVKAALFSADKATELFIKFVKQWNPLSGKQYTKLIHGRATVCHIFYQPLSEEEAWDIGFHGAACEFKTCLDCEKKQKEQLREMRRNGEKQPPDTTVTINSRADADHCRICTSRNLVKRGCGERRLMFDVEPVPVLQVKCAHCHEIFPPLPRKLPITPTITIDQSMATHRVR